MDALLQYIANGLVTGSFYAISALGLTLIFGLMKVVNFAHGQLYMLGGVLGWFTTTVLGLNFFIGLALTIVLMGGFGWLMDRFLIQRVRGQGEEPSILLTIGLSMFIANTALMVFGPAPMQIQGPFSNAPVFWGPVVLTNMRLLAVAASLVLIFAAHMLIRHTKLGRSMRATFQDPMAARLAGIKIARVYASTFALGSVLAASAGMLIGAIYTTQVNQGNAVSLTAFVVVIIGGMGSFAGAIVCGLVLGLAEALWGGYVSISTVKLVGFALVIMILMFKPYGLFSTPSERAS